MGIRISNHARERLETRMDGLISEREVADAVRKAGSNYGVGETAIYAKRVPYTYTDDGSNGDTVIVVVARRSQYEDPSVATVELRRSQQPARSRWSWIKNLLK